VLYLTAVLRYASVSVGTTQNVFDRLCQVMVFVYTFAVGGGSGKVVPFPRWALVYIFISSLFYKF